MTAIGLIAEFNPFHNGHRAIIQSIRSDMGEGDCLVVLMSASFVQRGGPAILPADVRAGCALACGADVVLDLPYAYSAQNAEVFALGATRLLSACGCEVLAFGSDADMQLLESAASLLNSEPDSARQTIKAGLDRGLGFARARHAVLEDEFGSAALALRAPDSILALEYARAILGQGLGLEMRSYPIRKGEGFAKASDIRGLWGNGARDNGGNVGSGNAIPGLLAELVPGDLYPKGAFGLVPHRPDDYRHAIKALLLGHPEIFLDVDGYEPGLENRLLRYADALGEGMEAFLDLACSKRHTKSRLRRMLFNAMIGYGKRDLELFRDSIPGWLRVAGFSDGGRAFLRAMKASGKVLPVPNPSALVPKGEVEVRMMALEGKSAALYGLFGASALPYRFQRPVQYAPVGGSPNDM